MWPLKNMAHFSDSINAKYWSVWHKPKCLIQFPRSVVKVGVRGNTLASCTSFFFLMRIQKWEMEIKQPSWTEAGAMPWIEEQQGGRNQELYHWGAPHLLWSTYLWSQLWAFWYIHLNIIWESGLYALGFWFSWPRGEVLIICISNTWRITTLTELITQWFSTLASL